MYAIFYTVSTFKVTVIKKEVSKKKYKSRKQDKVFVMDGDALIMPMENWKWLLGQAFEKGDYKLPRLFVLPAFINTLICPYAACL